MDALIAGLLALALIACLSWVWRRLRRIPEPPHKLDRILREDAAARYDTDAMAEMYDHINKERGQ